ncbi:flagellar basal body-associated FliL family protein [Desulfurispirillum indicum]|uniref:flagellar basal body-associated FliL family protein n=1 Tax=Desulfurispirillum indicum TaxID=936456 RepID=UPI001CF95C6E|nr:flagellar basal body-associated FliL family protein [Desulfurispirillum indicum]UCZ55514.1 flagellar basal body-associated FliL family protein [Desulfurispirillum indicum]
MAIEDKEEKESSNSPAKGGGSKKLLIIILILVLVLLLAGAGAYFLLRSPAPAAAPGAGADVPGAPTETTEIGTMYPMDTFIVNLADVLGKRYLRVTIQLEMDNPRLARELDRRSPQLRDAVLTILSSKKYEDISTAQGKLRLRSEIVSRVNAFLTSGSIRRVYFTEFVVQ